MSPQGALSPCCKFQLEKYKQTYNIQTDSLLDYVHSEFLQELREQFQAGEWPTGCERCRIEEENGIDSKRILDQRRWHTHYTNVDLGRSEFITASVAFGNTCNLKCITCNSYSSSKWRQEYQDIYGVDIRPVHFYRKDFVDTLVSQAPNLVHLDIPGGEPLLSGVEEQKKLLQHYIESGRAQDVSLHYTTNATVFPDQQWLDLWAHFNEIDIQLSIDGTGPRYEYIRYPAKWDVVVHNVHKYIDLERSEHNVRLSVSHTVSAYNIFYIPEFLSWCSDLGLPEPWLGRVHRPVHMRPEVWHSHARAFIQTKLSTNKNPISQTWASLLDCDESQHFDDFVKYTELHDRARSLSFAKTFSELAVFL